MTFLGRAKAVLETLSTVLVAVAASALIWTVFFEEQSPSTGAASPAVEDIKDVISAAYLDNVSGSGPLAIIEFTDFQCPFCARHAREIMPAIKREIVDSGMARYAVVNFPLNIHPQAIPAAEAAECAADDGKYWEMHDLLFERQGTLATADYAAYAKELGLNPALFAKCLSSDAKLAKVEADKALAARLQVRGTPGFFLGRMRADGGVDLLRRINGSASVQALLDEVAKLKG